jgi:predicted AAA+ superfamily ATPase
MYCSKIPMFRHWVRSDPCAFLEALRPPVVFDEIQNTPELLAYVRTVIETGRRRMGQWLFTGSQEAPLMQGIAESMAGRAASSSFCLSAPLGNRES